MVPSLRYRLTLLIAGVALAVITLTTVLTHVEMVRSDIGDETERLSRVTPQVANLFGASVPALSATVARAASDSAIRNHLRAGGHRLAATMALRPLQVATAAVAGVELWDMRGRRILSEPVALWSLSDAGVRELIALVSDSIPTAIGFISNETPLLHYSVISRVSDGHSVLGYVVLHRRLASTNQATQPFRDLIGDSITMLVGNMRGGLWTDFSRETPAPVVASRPRGQVARYVRPDGVEVLGVIRAIPNTPWSLAVEAPLAPVLADAAGVRRALIPASAVLFLVAVGLAWGLAGTVTQPVANLLAATKAIGAGDFARRATVKRRDELGALAIAFNHMAESIAQGRQALEKQAAELARGESRFRALIERSADGISLISADGSIVYQSPGGERVSGVPEGERVGNSFALLLHPDDIPNVQAAFEGVKAAHGSSRAFETRFKHADGTWHWAEGIYTNLIDDPHVSAVVTNYRDVTERKLAAAAREESEARFRQIAEHIKEAFFVVDVATGETLYMSPTWPEIYGRPIADGYDPERRLASVHEDDREILAAARALQFRGEATNVVFRIRRPDRSIRWVRSRSYPVRDQAGVLFRSVGVSEDITELRQVEERFTQAQKMEAVGRLAGGIAHDFNNLLTVILSYTEVLQSPPSTGDDHDEMLREVERAAQSAVSLTRQLLAFSRSELVEPKVFALNDVIAETSKMLRRLIGEDVNLETKLDPTVGFVRADRGHIEQLLTNLAVNARDAMPNGGLLSIGTTHEVLDEAYVRSHPAARAGDHIILTVSDTGGGMSPEIATRAFEPFFTTKEAGKGTGLGLATCHAIVEQWEGHISLYSEPGIGTTFRVCLPRVRATTPSTAATEAVLGGTETILLVEDNASVRTACARILRSQGYEVLEAPDAAHALRVLESAAGRVHLLLTDVVMPGLGGRELAERVTQRYPNIRVLFSSGYTDDVILQHQLIARDIQVLRKPYSSRALGQKVRHILDA